MKFPNQIVSSHSCLITLLSLSRIKLRWRMRI